MSFKLNYPPGKPINANGFPLINQSGQEFFFYQPRTKVIRRKFHVQTQYIGQIERSKSSIKCANNVHSTIAGQIVVTY